MVFSLIYLFLGGVNADEGWYLYASKLVFQGQIPYRDFAYTQMPLLPYIYGLPQVILFPSIYLGRVTSVLFSTTTLALCILIARRYAGEMGAGLTALLLGTFTYGIYFVSIVKTYALISLLFALVFFVLASNIPDNWKYIFAVIIALFAAMVRLSAIFFMIPIIIYSLAVALRRSTGFSLVAALCIALAGSASFFFLSDLEAIKWNLITHHISQWGDTPITDRIVRITIQRIPFFIQYFNPYVILVFSLLLLAARDVQIKAMIRPYLYQNPPLLVTGIGLVLFSISHLGTGGWYIEYFAPAVMVFLPIIAIIFSKICALQKSSSSVFLLQGMLIFTLLMTPLRHGMQHIDLSGGVMPLEEIREVSTYISKHSSSSDRLFALEALWIAIESDRSVLPGMTMAQFSYQNVNGKEAEKLKLVNGKIALEYINDCAATVVVLIDGDWQMFKRTGYDDLILQALASRYELVLTKEAFGQRSDNVYVYLCRSN